MLIDLTHKFASKMPVFPGDPVSELSQTAFMDKDSYNDHRLTTQMHVGTHIDAPLHMIPNGKRIDELSLESFIGNGVLINAEGLREIGLEVLGGVQINPGDVVLFQTNFSKKYGSREYFSHSPFLTINLAKKLIEKKVKLVGLDFAGPDIDPSWPVHKILLGAEIPIIENLTNLENLVNKDFEIIALPMNLKSDGSPARVVARID